MVGNLFVDIDKIYENAIRIFFKTSETMEELENESISLIVTSPPYFNYKYYGEGIGNEKTYGEYLENLKKVFKECYRVSFKGRTVAVNISNMKSRRDVEGKSFMYPIVADAIRLMQDIGFIVLTKLFG